jgi:vancomycin permeability regulator SanA
MIQKTLTLIFKTLTIFAAIGATWLILSRLVTWVNAVPRVFDVDTAPAKRVAVVFGAGLRRDSTPTAVLRDRVKTAADLYFRGKVEKILMSGDNRFDHYNEPGSMAAYARSLGVPESAIVLDYAGTSTYATCYRAKEIFAVQDVILVTQSFHLPRALYTCNALGVEAIGVNADNYIYRRISRLFWNLREVPATAKAVWDVHISRPVPVLGMPEPIFPFEAQ